MSEGTEEFEQAKQDLAKLADSLKSVMLGSSTSKGTPHVSYAPVYIDEHFNMFVFLSSMAKHNGLLKSSKKASAMIIEDELGCDNLFARKRVTFECSVEVLPREDDRWAPLIESMVDRLGGTMDYLKDMLDFDLFQLSPKSGRLVLGFGKAYALSGDDLTRIGFVNASGHITKDD